MEGGGRGSDEGGALGRFSREFFWAITTRTKGRGWAEGCREGSGAHLDVIDALLAAGCWLDPRILGPAVTRHPHPRYSPNGPNKVSKYL